MATYVGFTTAGPAGAVIATLGLITPSIIVILIIAGFLKAFKTNKMCIRDSIYTDAVTLKKVSEDVNRLLDRDEDLEEEENQELKKRLDRFMEEKYEKLNL